MRTLIDAIYPWIKSLHVISVIVWMGSQLLLPTLLAEHRGLPPSSARAAMLVRLERRLINRVMNPAMIAAFVCGGLLVSAVADTGADFPLWLGLKLGLVLVLAALHGRLLGQFRRAADGREPWGAWSCRWIQGLDFLLLIAVVLLVVARPFP